MTSLVLRLDVPVRLDSLLKPSAAVHRRPHRARLVRESALGDAFAELLRNLTFDDEVLGWISQALRDSHQDKKREHAEAVTRLRAEYDRLENRVDKMYDDKLDGKIGDEYFAKRAAEAREEQARIQRDLETYRRASETFVEDGVRILELAKGAYKLFISQPPDEKRRLLRHLVSNCT